MKKLLAFVLSCAMILSLTACTANEGTESESKQSKKFTVGFDAEYPPYGYLDEKSNEYVGFDLDLAQAVCDMEGWELVKSPISWDAKDMELKSGSIDCIWSGFTINGRENDYEWSDPYINNTQVVVVSEKSGIKKLSDLKDKVVGVQAASAAEGLFKEEGAQEKLGKTFKKLSPFSDYNTAFTELQAGSIDALAIDVGVAKYQLESRGKGYLILEENLNSEQYGIGFLKGNTELRDKINEDLKKLNDQGTVAELAQKYSIDENMICIGE